MSAIWLAAALALAQAGPDFRLPTLDASRSVTLAAERLFVTQPSVSYGLARLRELFVETRRPARGVERGRRPPRPSRRHQRQLPGLLDDGHARKHGFDRCGQGTLG